MTIGQICLLFFRKSHFVGTKPWSFIMYCLRLLFCYTGETGHFVHRMYGPQSLKYLQSSALQKKFTNPYTDNSVITLI